VAPPKNQGILELLSADKDELYSVLGAAALAILWGSSIALRLWHPEDLALIARAWRKIAGEVA